MSKLLRCLALALGMVLVLTFAPTIARAASSTDTVSFEGTVDYARAEEQLKLMNAERAKVGASPLTMSSALQNTAVVRAAETALYFDHVRPNGEKWDTALQAPVSGWWGENIAAGNSTAQAVTDQWMNSDGHRENMLRKEYRYVGIGCVTVGSTTYWCQNFAQSVGGGAASGGGSFTRLFTVEVNRSLIPASYTSISSSSSSDTLAPGATFTLTMKMRNPKWTYANVSTRASGYIWTSSNPSVLTVDKNGKVTAQNRPGSSATITATSPGGYSWSKTFTIAPDISAATVAPIPDQTYTGSAIKVHPVVTLNGKVLEEGEDYVIDYPFDKSDYTNAGTVTITLRGWGEVMGTKTVTYKILPRSLSGGSVSAVSEQRYTGKAIEPYVSVRLANGDSVPSSGYTVSYSNNVQPGTAKITVTGKGNYTGTLTTTFTIRGTTSSSGQQDATGQGPTVSMHRLYNPYTGEHLYTESRDERDGLTAIGWIYEGVGWTAPRGSQTPVWRLYNPYVAGGDHHYTTSFKEYSDLGRLGWNREGVGWYSDDAKGVPLYRQFNPYAQVGTHNYTTSAEERDMLVRLGWHDEGVGWYGVKK